MSTVYGNAWDEGGASAPPPGEEPDRTHVDVSCGEGEEEEEPDE